MTQPDIRPEPNDPYRLLAEADAAFTAGDHYGGSALLWRAAERAMVNLAEQCGRPHDIEGDDLFFFAKWLDEQSGTMDYSGGHTAASLFGDNAKYQFIHPEEMVFSIPHVHEFVAALASYPAPTKTRGGIRAQDNVSTELVDPYRLLAEADVAFAAGDYDDGSTLLWKAAERAMVNLAKQCGRPHDTDGDDLFLFVKWLDEQNDTVDYFGGYVIAELFGNNAKHRYIEREEMDIIRPNVHEFVAALTSYPTPTKTRGDIMAQYNVSTEPADPHRLLAKATVAFAAGDHDGGSTLLWKAAERAMVNLAQQCGRPHNTEGDDLFLFVKWLDEQNDTENYFGGYVIAELFGNNAKHHYIEREEMDIIRPDVHDFVAALTSYPAPAKAV